MWEPLSKNLPQQLSLHKSFNLRISQSQYFYEVELVWNVFPKLLMLHSCFLLQKLLPLICFHVLHPHPLCKKPLPKTMLQISVKLEYPLTSRPHLKISENEKHIALIFWFTEEFFLSSLVCRQGSGSFIRKDFTQVTLENIYIRNVYINNGFRGNSSCESC